MSQIQGLGTPGGAGPQPAGVPAVRRAARAWLRRVGDGRAGGARRHALRPRLRADAAGRNRAGRRGRRIGAFLLATVLCLVTLVVGYAIWTLFTWRDGRTPVQQLLRMRCWDTQGLSTASRGTMLLRGLCQLILDPLALGGLISLGLFAAERDRRTLGDHVSGVVVLHDPGNILG